MLRRPPANLNVQSQDATILLIQEVLKKGIELTEARILLPNPTAIALTPNTTQVYVDALGTTSTYQAYLSSCFPGINFTVESKADDKFKITVFVVSCCRPLQLMLLADSTGTTNVLVCTLGARL
jgi:ribonuclease H2 subunit A